MRGIFCYKSCACSEHAKRQKHKKSTAAAAKTDQTANVFVCLGMCRIFREGEHKIVSGFVLYRNVKQAVFRRTRLKVVCCGIREKYINEFHCNLLKMSKILLKTHDVLLKKPSKYDKINLYVCKIEEF